METPTGKPSRPKGFLASTARSFRFAGDGIAYLLKTQGNARIHMAASVAVVALAVALRVDRIEWMLLLLSMASVWASETVNTALELLADAVHPEPHPLVGRAKDLSAAAVLLTALGSASVGALVFVPKLLALVV